MQLLAGTHLDVPGDSRTTVLDDRVGGEQRIDFTLAGGRPEPQVSLELSGTSRTTGGEATDSASYETTAFSGFADPIEAGPTATGSFSWRVRNRSSTDYTQATNSAYQTFIGYAVSQLTVLDKLRLGYPITEAEDRLREKFQLDRYTRFSLVPSRDEFYAPNLEGKSVIAEQAHVDTFDVQQAGEGNRATVLDLDVHPEEVVYITGVAINGQDYAPGDNLTLTFTRNNGAEEFYRMETIGFPGIEETLPLHIPILSDLTVGAFANSPVSNVDIQIEYARVHRTLTEKALYGLSGEVKSDDRLAGVRTDAYEMVRELIEAGVPINSNIPTVLDDVGAAEALRRNTIRGR